MAIFPLCAGCGQSGDVSAQHAPTTRSQTAELVPTDSSANHAEATPANSSIPAQPETATASEETATSQVAITADPATQQPDAGDSASSADASPAERQPTVGTDAANPAEGEIANKDGKAGKTEDAAAKDATPKYEVLIKDHNFPKDKASGALRVSFDDLDLLKVLNMKQATGEAVELMPDWLKGLDGKRVRIRGFMHPQSVFQAVGIQRFVFCRDTGVCCFGPKPTIYYLIGVALKKGATASYIDNRHFDVVGTFHIKLSQVKETGEVFELYHITDAEIIEK